MKKTYMQPVTILVNVKIQSLLFAESKGDGSLSGGGSKGNLGSSDEVLSRGRGRFFDDDED